MQNYDLVIGIDSGKGGGICHYTNSQYAKAVSMPPSTRELYLYLRRISEGFKPIVFLEKVSLFMSDSDDANKGKQFRIQIMLQNYCNIVACLEILSIPYVEVPAVTWQTRLNLKGRKGESKGERKKRYCEFARAWIPYLKPTLKTADSICLLIFGQKMMKQDKIWVNARLNLFAEDLFEQVENTL